FFSSRRRHTRFSRDWSSDVCSSDLYTVGRLELELLCQASFDLGGQHDFVRVDGVDDERQLDIRESQCLMAGGNKTFAVDVDKSLKDSMVVNLPGTELLLDHVETSKFGFG